MKETHKLPTGVTLSRLNLAARQLQIPAKALRSLHRRRIHFTFEEQNGQVLVRIVRSDRQGPSSPSSQDSQAARNPAAAPSASSPSASVPSGTRYPPGLRTWGRIR